MNVHNILAPLPVTEIAAARRWYTDLLGRIEDAAPMPNVVEWRFAGGGWLQLHQDADRAGQGAATLVVADIAQVRDRLNEVGHAFEPFDSDVTALAVVADPDGNQLVFAQSRDAARNPSAVAKG